MLVKTISSPVADVDAVQGIVKGYFAHFGSKDSDGDIIQKSAFDKTVRENGPTGTNRIKHILNHDTGRPLAAIKELQPDSTGLPYVSQLLKSKSGVFLPDAEMILAGIESGYNFEHSIGYAIPNGKQEKTADGNLLHELKLYEGSTLTFYGANQNTPITGLKSASGHDPLDLLLFFEKSLRTGNWSDDYYKLIQQKHAELSAAIALLVPATQPPVSTEPESLKASDVADLISAHFKINI